MDWIYTEENPLKVFTAFSGYDSQMMALRNLGIPYVCVGWSEIDKYAIMAHDAVFPEDKGKNYGDISKINWDEVPDFDFMTYSSPCQDFSNAGLQKGGEEGSGTRSSLLWEVKKAVMAKHPAYLLMENVKALVSKKFMPTFQLWLDWLSTQGYTNFWAVLNAKDYGVPQNRERVFVVSSLEPMWYNFPQPIPLNLRLKDLLEDKVDEKYYIDQTRVEQFISQLPPEKLKDLEDGKC